MKEEILAKIIERGAPLFGVDKDKITADTTFEECNAKSAHISQITTFLEDEYDVEVPFMGFRRQKNIWRSSSICRRHCRKRIMLSARQLPN